jgi:RES domain
LLPVPSAILDPLLDTWEAGRLLLRCHNVGFGATEFNPGLGQGRFHPFVGRYGVTVPVLYASDSLDGVLSETIFHGVATSGHLRLIQQDALRPMVVSTLAARRDLCLAQLHGHGLRRLGLTRRDLIDSEADGYAARLSTGPVGGSRAWYGSRASTIGRLP